MELTLAGIALRARSVAGTETCIELPGHRLCFDIGRCTSKAAGRCRTILCTHAHVDHLGALAHHVSRRAMWGLPPTRLIVPASEVEAVHRLLEAWRTLARSELPCEVIGAEPGVELSLGKKLSVRPFRASHRVPTLGYALVRRARRLRAELRGLPGPQIAARREAGEDVTEPFEEVEVAFTGDTRAAVLAREPWLSEARLLIIECTFLDGDHDVARADRTGHVALADLARHADRLTQDAVLLTHFSSRYAPDEVRAALTRVLPRDVRSRVTPLIPP